MTTTMTDAMTAADLFAQCSAIRSKVGPRAYVSADVSISEYRGAGDPACVHIWPDGITGRAESCFFRASTWREALIEAHAWADTYQPVHHNALIRRMALAIIEITDEHGSCTDILLRAKQFTAAEIAEYHVDACARAGEMAGNTPFSVVMGGL